MLYWIQSPQRIESMSEITLENPNPIYLPQKKLMCWEKIKNVEPKGVNYITKVSQVSQVNSQTWFPKIQVEY